MERIVEGYAIGFTKGLIKVREMLTSGLVNDMKRHNMRFTQRTMIDIINCMIDNRATLRDNPFAFVRCTKDGKFEVYEGEKI